MSLPPFDYAESLNLNNYEIFVQNFLKDQTFVVSTTQFPGNGGAATNAYNIFLFLRKKYKVVMLYHEDITKHNGDTAKFNPAGVKGVFFCPRITESVKNAKKTHKRQIALQKCRDDIIEYLGSEPSVCLSKNYISPPDCKYLFPGTKVLYLVSGSVSFSNYIKENAVSYDKAMNSNIPLDITEKEQIALDVSDVILPNSMHSLRISKHTYQAYEHKLPGVYDTTLISYIALKNKNKSYYIPRNDRKYDVMYTVSRHDRTVKNSQFVFELIRQETMKDLKWLIIGDGIDEYISEEQQKEYSHVTFLPQQNNNANIKYMQNSKVMLIPSLYDACPNVQIEGIYSGCNMLVSNNIGYSDILYADTNFNVCENYELETWTSKILAMQTGDYVPDINTEEIEEIVTEELFSFIYGTFNKNYSSDTFSLNRELKERNFVSLSFMKINKMTDSDLESLLNSEYGILVPKVFTPHEIAEYEKIYKYFKSITRFANTIKKCDERKYFGSPFSRDMHETMHIFKLVNETIELYYPVFVGKGNFYKRFIKQKGVKDSTLFVDVRNTQPILDFIQQKEIEGLKCIVLLENKTADFEYYTKFNSYKFIDITPME